MTERDLRTGLLSIPAPDEHIAEERTWDVVRVAYLAREPVPRSRRLPVRLLVVIAVVGAVAAVGIIWGTTIWDWFRDAVGRERVTTVGPETVPASLPAAGRLLVAAGDRVLVVAHDGSEQVIGEYEGASWSPDGVFATAWRGRELAALDPTMTDFVHWSLEGDRIAAARWSADGARVAYVSGSSLRVVVGNGTGDRELASPVAAVAPAWQPGDERVLAYADPDGRVLVVEADSGERRWRTAAGSPVRGLAWTDDGSRLAVLGERLVRVFSAPRRLLRALRLPAGVVATGLAPRPGGHEIAYTVYSERTGQGSVFVVAGRRSRLLFTGAGELGDLVWSPDGSVLLVGWKAADQWVFLPAEQGGPVRVAADVGRNFPGEGFPRVEGWCCAAPGA